MASKPPDAFLSYTRFDDRHDGGAISELCQRLASAVRAVTGVPFKIFQDVGGIGIGEHWPGKLDEMLSEARFFIPIVTPSYFTSKACREELEKFLRAEAERERNDLVLPIYYIESEVLEHDDLRAADPLASTLHERQRQDWRDLRFEPFEATGVRRALEQLAREIVKTRRRAISGRAEAQLQQPKENELSAAKQLRAKAVRNRAVLRAALPMGTADLLTPPGIAKVLSQAVPRTTSRKQADKLFKVTVFRDIDAPWCPELVVIAPGEFMMGSTSPEHGLIGAEVEWERERPQHLVRVAYPLAVGQYPVTFAEYSRFARTTGRAQPDDEGWGRGRRPVINVDWEDAKAFVAWISVRTGHRYRLLSEAEWEYVCRAGTTTRYSWGDDPPTSEQANFMKARGTTEVGTYAPNPWGLYDMHGNVWEWVEDCWNESYSGAPKDGSAWSVGDCGTRMMRGGCWLGFPETLRSAHRQWFRAGDRDQSIGFRVARTLTRNRQRVH